MSAAHANGGTKVSNFRETTEERSVKPRFINEI